MCGVSVCVCECSMSTTSGPIYCVYETTTRSRVCVYTHRVCLCVYAFNNIDDNVLGEWRRSEKPQKLTEMAIVCVAGYQCEFF